MVIKMTKEPIFAFDKNDNIVEMNQNEQ